MSMSKKDFIALADELKWYETQYGDDVGQTAEVWRAVRDDLILFCKRQNPQFNEERWLGYLRGECGPNGGKVKPIKVQTVAESR